MDCGKFRSLLDAYIDGVLDEVEMRQFMDHAQACESCGQEMREAEMLRDLMKDMDDDIAVPLQAQAAWRNAVRAESKKIRMRRFVKIVSAAAAALVLVVGCSLAIGSVNQKNAELTQVQPMMLKAMPAPAEGNELIARDGSAEAAALSDTAENYAAVRKFETEAYDEAYKALSLLCEEYNGVMLAEETVSAEGVRENNCRIELPYEYMSDFLNAVSRIGVEIQSETGSDVQETALLLIQILEK